MRFTTYSGTPMMLFFQNFSNVSWTKSTSTNTFDHLCSLYSLCGDIKLVHPKESVALVCLYFSLLHKVKKKRVDNSIVVFFPGFNYSSTPFFNPIYKVASPSLEQLRIITMIMLYGKFGFVFWPLPSTYIREKWRTPTIRAKQIITTYNASWIGVVVLFCPNFWLLYLKKKSYFKIQVEVVIIS